MQLSDSLEVAIGLSFVFLLLSLIMTALQEAVESVLKVRGAHLFDGLIEMLSDPDHPLGATVDTNRWKRSWSAFWGYTAPAPAPAEDAVQALYEHPLIHGLYRGDFTTAKRRNQLPSYIPSRNFALAIIGQVLKARIDAAPAVSQLDAAGAPAYAGVSLPQAATQAEQLRLAAERIQSAPLRRAVKQAIEMGAGDMALIQKNLEIWYDSGMDRVSGWYRRRTHTFLFVTGLLAAIILNINALMIADSLAQNATLRRAVAASAETNLQANDPDKAFPASAEPVAAAAPAAPASDPAAAKTAEQLKAEADATAAAETATFEKAKADAAKARQISSRAIGDIQALGLPIGWGAAGRNAYDHALQALEDHTLLSRKRAEDAARAAHRPLPGKPLLDWPRIGLMGTVFLGWLMTALAVTLGAPFWFDVLNRLVVIRSTVKPHEKSGEERSQDPHDKSGRTVKVQVGTEAPSPTAPTPPSSDDHDPVVAHLNPGERPREGDEHDPHVALAV